MPQAINQPTSTPQAQPTLSDFVEALKETVPYQAVSNLVTDAGDTVQGLYNMLVEGVQNGGWASYAGDVADHPVEAAKSAASTANLIANHYGLGVGPATIPQRTEQFFTTIGKEPVQTLLLLDGLRALTRTPNALRGIAESPEGLYARALLSDETGAVRIPNGEIPAVPIRVARKAPEGKGYDIGPLGDSRFTEANATFSDGRTIAQALSDISEEAVIRRVPQRVVKGGYDAYRKLWYKWADENPDMMAVLWDKVQEGKMIVDPTMNSQYSPAQALSDIMKDAVRREQRANLTPVQQARFKQIVQKAEKERAISQADLRNFGMPTKDRQGNLLVTYPMRQIRRAAIDREESMLALKALERERLTPSYPGTEQQDIFVRYLQDAIERRAREGKLVDEYGRPMADENLNLITYDGPPQTMAEFDQGRLIGPQNGESIRMADPVEGRIEETQLPPALAQTADDALEQSRSGVASREAERLREKSQFVAPLEENPFNATDEGITTVALKDWSKQYSVGKDGKWGFWQRRPRYEANPLTGNTASPSGGADLTDNIGGFVAEPLGGTPIDDVARANMLNDRNYIERWQPIEGTSVEYVGFRWAGKMNDKGFDFRDMPLASPFKIGRNVSATQAVELYKKWLFKEYSKGFKGEPSRVFDAINDILDKQEQGLPLVLVDTSNGAGHAAIIRMLLKWIKEHPTARRGNIPNIDTIQ